MSKFKRNPNDWINLATMAAESVAENPHLINSRPAGREFITSVAMEMVAIVQNEGVAQKLKEEANQWPDMLAAAAQRLQNQAPTLSAVVPFAPRTPATGPKPVGPH